MSRMREYCGCNCGGRRRCMSCSCSLTPSQLFPVKDEKLAGIETTVHVRRMATNAGAAYQASLLAIYVCVCGGSEGR